ncbi:hypothetical protein GCK72_004995 [Caenorhabditis remanei]|uniref:Uncharacterized protein n=1 Tax=Caenorhabditis remanei TaxID=31234 RepID=A0A6A5HDX7_CAERE|nr:hypothetical protein GCK72_004995 [Caenorhabditis remanei]KAF1765044.1 hypothetical protein GCK72_004995 [Caenorhabditis remanei]
MCQKVASHLTKETHKTTEKKKKKTSLFHGRNVSESKCYGSFFKIQSKKKKTSSRTKYEKEEEEVTEDPFLPTGKTKVGTHFDLIYHLVLPPSVADSPFFSSFSP